MVILKIEENGPQSCDLSPNSNFVSVRIPIKVHGEGPPTEGVFRYSIGPFQGRDVPLTLENGLETELRFRIPLELFTKRERLTVEVRSQVKGGLSWSKRYSADWEGRSPSLEATAET